MLKLLEKYYNINYYCTYKLLFFIFDGANEAGKDLMIMVY
mgnify:CR=1 FL=1|jgi:hypothetical protein